MSVDRTSKRLFVVIPAAGQGRRMGAAKLLLPWNGSTVIEQLLSALDRPEISAVVVVVRSDDGNLRQTLRRTAAICVTPAIPPPYMRDSVNIGLREIRERFHPSDDDGWLLIPADHPLIEPTVLDGLLERWSRGDCQILVPTFGAQRGHPTLFRWELAKRVEELPADCGLNAILRSDPALVTEWPTSHESVLADLDTPEDYARWQTKLA